MPATTADIQAAHAIIQSAHANLQPVLGETGLGLSYFAEELAKPDGGGIEDGPEAQFIEGLGDIQRFIKRTPAEFKRTSRTSIAVLFDSLDGTTNFRAGLPMFCSAVAFFIDRKPRVAALHDPCRNLVYYGSLRSETTLEDPEGRAHVWDVANGTKLPLPLETQRVTNGGTKLLATHVTRSDEDAREAMLKILKSATPAYKGTYMLNSGQLALAYVASGHISSFMNNKTSTWDVAAGEVLVKAAGGRISGFDGEPINYWDSETVDVVAGDSEESHKELLEHIARESGERPADRRVSQEEQLRAATEEALGTKDD